MIFLLLVVVISGGVCALLGLRGVRVWQVRGFENYLVFYQPTQRGIEVIRLLHAARDIEGILADELQ